MKKSLLLDADVVIDLHSLSLFDKIRNAYNAKVTREVFGEAKGYLIAGKKKKINIKGKVTIIDSVDIKHLKKVLKEAKQARLSIDSGEATSIAYILQDKEDIIFCTCDKAAIKLLSYMNLNQKSTSLQKALKSSSIHARVYVRHYDSTFKDCVREGKALRIQYKNFT